MGYSHDNNNNVNTTTQDDGSYKKGLKGLWDNANHLWNDWGDVVLPTVPDTDLGMLASRIASTAPQAAVGGVRKGLWDLGDLAIDLVALGSRPISSGYADEVLKEKNTWHNWGENVDDYLYGDRKVDDQGKVYRDGYNADGSMPVGQYALKGLGSALNTPVAAVQLLRGYNPIQPITDVWTIDPSSEVRRTIYTPKAELDYLHPIDSFNAITDESLKDPRIGTMHLGRVLPDILFGTGLVKTGVKVGTKIGVDKALKAALSAGTGAFKGSAEAVKNGAKAFKGKVFKDDARVTKDSVKSPKQPEAPRSEIPNNATESVAPEAETMSTASKATAETSKGLSKRNLDPKNPKDIRKTLKVVAPGTILGGASGEFVTEDGAPWQTHLKNILAGAALGTVGKAAYHQLRPKLPSKGKMLKYGAGLGTIGGGLYYKENIKDYANKLWNPTTSKPEDAPPPIGAPLGTPVNTNKQAPRNTSKHISGFGNSY